jgi:hypothetical protein
MSQILNAIAGMQLTIAGVSLAILFDFHGLFWPLGVLSVLFGTLIVGGEIYREGSVE